ncbi:sialate O-acetylesterase [Sphingobacterium sp. SGG-5]|nr:sialate O-acetylesterase [Sphingobacterium sp. SGG-5]
MKRVILGVLFLCVVFGQVFAQVTFPSIFSDGMVLQQQTDVQIWGWAKSKLVTISTSWNKKTYQVPVNADGSWRTKVATTKAGGPYTMELKDDKSSLVLSDILLGEVWLASGQSNMEMPLKGFKNQPVTGSEEIVSNSENSSIRFFNVKNKSWAKPLDDVEGEWLSASPATTSNFSATAYFFAKELHEKMNVPVAIVQSDWGGTLVQAWMSGDALKAFPQVNVKTSADSMYSNKNESTGLYNAMIHPIVGYGIKGAIWYQGEQNRHEPELYSKLFPAMVKQWRTEWNVGDFPFYYVQIAPYIFRTPDKLSTKLAQLRPYVPYLREAQMQAENVIPNSGMAVLMDVSSQFTIHPPDKQSVGKRLSYQALNKSYDFKDVAYAGPVYKKMEVKGPSAILHFDHADGLYLKDKASVNFIIAGADKVFYPATAIIEGKTVRVESDKVKNPVAVRYAFDAWVIGDLFNKENLPASSFRTDNWAIGEAKNTEIKAPVEDYVAPKTSYRNIIAIKTTGNQLLAWQFALPTQSNGRETTANATAVHANLEASALKRGPGVTVQAGSARGFNGHFPTNKDFKSAEKSGAYYEFTVKAKPGEKVSLHKLDAVLRRQSGSAYIYRWVYSTDGTNFNKIGAKDMEVASLSNNGEKQPSVDLSGYKDLQKVPSSKTITLRLYAWGGTSKDRKTSAFGFGKSTSQGSIVLNLEGVVTGVSSEALQN